MAAGARATIVSLGAALALAFFFALGLAFVLGETFLRLGALRAGAFLDFFFALVLAFFLLAMCRSSTLRAAAVREKVIQGGFGKGCRLCG
jgi:hypothetical protein